FEIEEKKQDHIKDFIRPFDLTLAPLLRVGLLKTPNDGPRDRHLLMMDMHHIITDGISMEIFLKELILLYDGEQLPPLRLRYRDYSRWQEEKKTAASQKKQEEYWLKKFAGEVPQLSIPTDYPRPLVRSFEGRTFKFRVGENDTAALKEMALQEEVTLYMVLLSIYSILLSKISGRDDIVVGTPT
ncbi:MAG: hypothetical protein GY757_12165, partial [bacterium]|nr:hypothetical protein [bacterium]